MTIADKKLIAGGLTAAAAAVLGTQGASAADYVAPVEEPLLWDGVYIGAMVGFMDGDAPFDLDNDYEWEGDVVFGGFIGLNHQFDSNFVVGAELAVQSTPDVTEEGADNDYDVDYIADAKFKLGWAMDNFLPYIFGGISGGESSACCGEDYGFYGFNYGIGADWKFTEHFSIGAELLGRTIVDPYSNEDNDSPSHWQGMLRAAFHF